MENDFRTKEINAKEGATIQNDGNERTVHKKPKIVVVVRRQEQS